MWSKLKKIDNKMWNNRCYRTITSIPRKIFHVIKRIHRYGVTYPIRLLKVKLHQMADLQIPAVSIVMPVYNVEKYIEQAMNSLLQQTLKNIEIIAVDDGSTDQSLEILKGYASKDKRVKVFSQQNKYAGAARNLGLGKASGEYVIFLDSDDFFDKNLVRDTYLVAKSNKADIVLFGAKYFNNQTGHYSDSKSFMKDYLSPAKQPFNYKDCPDYLYQLTTACPWTKIFRREFLEDSKLQFQNLKNSNDVFFIYSLLAMADRIVTFNKALVYYRIGLTTNLQATKKKSPLCFYTAFKAWHDKIVELNLMGDLRKSYVNAALEGCLYNLRSTSDIEAKKIVFEKIKNEAFEALEILGHEQTYYYNKKNYEDMLLVKNGSFEEYMELS